MGGKREGAETAKRSWKACPQARRREGACAEQQAFVESLSVGAGAGKRACAEQQAFVEAYPQVRTQEGARAEQQSVRGGLSAGVGKRACAEQQAFVEAYPRARTQESARELSSKGVGRGTNPIPRAFAARQTDNRKFSRRRS